MKFYKWTYRTISQYNWVRKVYGCDLQDAQFVLFLPFFKFDIGSGLGLPTTLCIVVDIYNCLYISLNTYRLLAVVIPGLGSCATRTHFRWRWHISIALFSALGYLLFFCEDQWLCNVEILSVVIL